MTAVETELAEVLVRLSHRVQHVFADVSREHGLTPQQTQLLCILTDGPVGMTELTHLLHLEKSSLTGLVDRVERRELVSRTRDERDRRGCRIALTDHGYDFAVAAHADVVARLDTLTSGLQPADKSRIATVIAGVLADDPGAPA